MHSTNYFDTFICIAPDSDAERGSVPKESATPSVALRTFRMIQGAPYKHTRLPHREEREPQSGSLRRRVPAQLARAFDRCSAWRPE
jgi:hypothetical protein